MLAESEIRQLVRQFIIDHFQFRAGATSLSDSESLLETGIIDSVGVLELIAFLESQFSIRIADSDLVPENLDMIERISAFVRKKTQIVVAADESEHAR